MTRIYSICCTLTLSLLLLGLSSLQEAAAGVVTSSAQIVAPSTLENFAPLGAFTFEFGAFTHNVGASETINLTRQAGTAVKYGEGPTTLTPANTDWTAAEDGYLGTVGVNTVMRLAFPGGDIAGIGAIFSYDGGVGPTHDVVFSAYDVGNSLLEQFTLAGPFQISGQGANAGLFRGIQRSSVDIAYIEIDSGSSNAVVLDDLVFTRTASSGGSASIPEPSSLALAAIGLVAFLSRSRRRAARR